MEIYIKKNNNNEMACFASKVQQGNKENCCVNNIYDLANKILEFISCAGFFKLLDAHNVF